MYIPSTTPAPPSPPISENCAYQVRIERSVYKCFTEAEYNQTYNKPERVPTLTENLLFALIAGIMLIGFVIYLINLIKNQ
jgi:hypothetical protein